MSFADTIDRLQRDLGVGPYRGTKKRRDLFLENHNWRRVTDEDVKLIRVMHRNGVRQSRIAVELVLNPSTISRVVNRQGRFG